MSKAFKLASQFQPAGDQPNAIAKLLEGIDAGLAHQNPVQGDWFRQNVHDGECDRQAKPSNHDFGAE